MADKLATSAHFRPEVTRKIRAVREEEIRKLKRVSEDEKLEERNLRRDKERKEQRDKQLQGMNADQQRKFLENERKREAQKTQKKMTKRG